MINCIIICAGDASRWNNYLNVPKHLIKIDGETLIERTVKLLHKYKKEPININIVVKDLTDKRYKVKEATRYKADLNPENFDADKFLSSKKLWNKTGRTLVIYGDVWFTEKAIKMIMDYTGEDWTLFANFEECFAQSFYPKDIPRHLKALYIIRDAFINREITRCGGWEHYRAFNNKSLGAHSVGPNFYLIFDETNDFDFPKDYDEFIEIHEALKNGDTSRINF